MKKIDSIKSIEEDIIVRSGNDLTNLHQSFYQCELDIIFYLLHIFKENERNYSFPVSAIEALTGKRWKTSDLCVYTDTLISRRVSIIQDIDERWSHHNLFEGVEYDKGIMKLSLTNFALPLFSNTKSRFTFFILQNALSLNSKHSKRLYWLLSQWKSKGEKRYSIDELEVLMGMRSDTKRDNTYYCKHNGSFRRIISKACLEINERTELFIQDEWNKCSRQMSSVTFFISERKRLEAAQEKASEAEARLASRVRQYHCFTDEEVHLMSMNGLTAVYFEEIVSRVISVSNKSMLEGDMSVQDVKKYLRRCIENEGYLGPASEKVSGRGRPRRKTGSSVDRSDLLSMLRTMESSGADISSLMAKYGVTREELCA